MKLYTEEQVTKLTSAAFVAGQNHNTFIFGEEFKNITPIELPSDVEVGKIVLGNSPIMEHRDSGYFAAGAMKYNKWLKEQILNQNK